MKKHATLGLLLSLSFSVNHAIAEDTSGAYLGAFADGLFFDDELDLDGSLGGGLGLGYMWSHFAIEGSYHYLETEQKYLNYDVDVQWPSLDVAYFINPILEHSPYFKLGYTNLDYDSGSFGDYDEDHVRFGIGYQYWFDKKFALRLEALGLYGVDEDPINTGVQLGLIYFLGEEKSKPAPAAPKDSDNDGVNDSSDQCPNTPAGTAVNAQGCPLDSDGDGVVDGKDQCPNTPQGVTVDAQGCPMDSDKDGVVDNNDQCPNTPRGAEVDQKGCEKQLEKEVNIELRVEFDSGKSTLRPGADAEIQKVADFLRRYPSASAVIEGHTDSQGAASFNQRLSEQRAQAVMQRLITVGNVSPQRLSAVGYGEVQPIADNTTAAGRQRNRRVVASISTVTKN